MTMFDYVLTVAGVLLSAYAVYQFEKSRMSTFQELKFGTNQKVQKYSLLKMFKAKLQLCLNPVDDRFDIFPNSDALIFQNFLLGMQENIRSYALLLTSNEDIAQDVMKNTTLKVLENQDKFINNLNFKGWVLTVMRNIFINNYNKIVRTQKALDNEDNLFNLNIDDFSFDIPEGAYHVKAVTKALNNLNSEYRIPFCMFLSGYKYREISEKLNIPIGTVKSRIFFARHELQDALKDFNNISSLDNEPVKNDQ